HVAGDECLKRVAGALSGLFRRPGDLLGRYGGEEFTAVLAETPLSAGVALAEGARLAVERLAIQHRDSPASPHVTISVGAASGCSGDFTALLSAADAALYRAKQGGRNRVESA
ncbi:MAG TPA: diguanylate cyclase, partial [Verrucomicrobiae bacterium]|nr:diguanylate cyclase [Verrucomicrobiae bacterium]